ncbi:MAG: ATP-binding protein [Candidatus Omnitrophota bacterium]
MAPFNFSCHAQRKSPGAYFIIIASSDGYFLNTVYNDSRLKKTSTFYKVDYLSKDDVMEWLLNLEKYSINAYNLTKKDVEKIWDTVGGSMWEIQDILSKLFSSPIDEVLTAYIKKIRSMIVSYTAKTEKKSIEKLLERLSIRMNCSRKRSIPKRKRC